MIFVELGKSSTRSGRHSQKLDFMTRKIKWTRNCYAQGGNVKFVFQVEKMVNFIVHRAIEYLTEEVPIIKNGFSLWLFYLHKHMFVMKIHLYF